MFSSDREHNKVIASWVVAMLNPVVVTPEAVEAVKELLFSRSMEKHTQVIKERLDLVEYQLSAAATQHPEESTGTQDMSGIPRELQSMEGLAEQEATPSGGGAIPTGSAIPGLICFSPELDTRQAGVTLSPHQPICQHQHILQVGYI